MSTVQLILVSASAVLCVSLVKFLYGVYRRRKILGAVPGFEEDPIVGNVRLFYNKTPRQFFEVFMRGTKELGSVFKIHLLHESIVFVSDPRIIEVVMPSNQITIKSKEYEPFHKWLGTGLVTSNGEKWQARRKAITPTFHFKILDCFMDVFNRNAGILVDQLKKNRPTESVNVVDPLSLASLDIICETAMGTSIDAQLRADSEYVNAVNEITHIMMMRLFDFILRCDLTYGFSEASRREKKCLKVLHDFSNGVIVNRRQELAKSGGNKTSAEDDSGVRKKKALLDSLLELTINGESLKNEDIREEVDTFMFAGHDTTTTSASFALYCIAKNPEVQRKLLQEIRDVVGDDKSEPVTMKTLNELHYLDLVIKEAMRMFPPVPLIARFIEEDVEINGTKIPAGVSLMMSVMNLHNNPEIFPEPEKFIPERFEKMLDNPYHYIPFSAGPRNCIGQKFALLALKTLLVYVVRGFELSLDPEHEELKLFAEIVLKTEGGIRLKFKERC